METTSMKVRPAPPPLDGELRFDEATRKRSADDFGHIVHRMPEGVLRPASANDVAKTIQWTAQRGGTFAAQGRRHSTFGRSQVQDGIVADMSTLRNIGAVEHDRVVVEAGAKWSDVLRATLAQGKTPPVLTEYIELSVGGTLVVGGIGGTTSAFGAQCDNVIEMEVVTGHGHGSIMGAPDGIAFHLDAVKYFKGDAPDDAALLAGLSDDPAARQSATLAYCDDTSEVNRLIAANEATYERVKAAGGTLYPVSAFGLSSARWRDHFGSAFGQLDAAKQEFDPGRTLTPGYGIFQSWM